MVKPTFALSSCWNSFRHQDGDAMLREIADLGFTHAELSHGTRIVLVPGIMKAVEAGMIKISSTHNFCPLPTGITQSAPNLFEPSALNDQEHQQWVRHSKRSIDFAAQIKARVLVMHLGSARFFWGGPGGKLEAYVEKHPTADVMVDAGYQKLLRKSVEKLRKKMVPYWTAVRGSIEDVRAYAAGKGVALGFENREKFEELPMDDDFGELFDSLEQPHTCGYWHDTGHADIKQSLGLLNQRAHLQKNADRLLGFHLHDVTADGKDHQPIGAGHVDFEMVSSFWKPEHLLTLELSPRVTTEQVVDSKQRIEALIAARPELA